MKNALVQIRISPLLKEEMTKRAVELNMTLTAYLIHLVQKDLKKI